MLAAVIFLHALASCSTPQWHCKTLPSCRGTLSDRSKDQVESIDKLLAAGRQPDYAIGIVGDGIAGTSVALNLKERSVRIFGGASFWNGLQALPSVWQTDLSGPFLEAGLPAPATTGFRIPRDSVLLANLEGLASARGAYTALGNVTVVPTGAGKWDILDAEGRRESVSRVLIVATGLLRPLQIDDRLLGLGTVRSQLVQSGRILTGDQLLSTSVDLRGRVVGILGAAGNAADCLLAAIIDSASDIVVWGPIDTNLVGSKSYKDLVAQYGDRLCHVDDFVTGIELVGTDLVVNGDPHPLCINPSHAGQHAPSVSILIESLGRLNKDPPPIIVAAAAGRQIVYRPVIEPGSGALIGVCVLFAPATDCNASNAEPPIYLVGASATWLPDSVSMSSTDSAAFTQSLLRTVAIVDSLSAPNTAAGSSHEHPRAGFAVAAYMGAHLARHLTP